jgi:hypothetical protein
MKTLARYCIGIAAVAGFASQASATDTIRFEIRAEVAPFCQISSSVSEDTPVELNGGQASLGVVNELCNTRNGYTVRAAFTNLNAGTVVAASDQAQIDALGMANFSSVEARRQTRAWQLVDARKAQEGSPVFMRLTISPTF